MNLEALWSVEYATNHGDFGTGVAVLVDGSIYGGDADHCYHGEYTFADGEFRGHVRLRLHSGRPAPLCASDERITLQLHGRQVGSELEINGTVEQEPMTTLFIHLIRESALPGAGAGDCAGRPDTPASEPCADTGHGFLIGEASDRLPVL